MSGDQPDVTSVERFFSETFSDYELREKHHNMLQYQIGAHLLATEPLPVCCHVSLFIFVLASSCASLSRIFGALEQAKEELSIEDYSVSQTTLDQVFINFAMLQDSDRSAQARTTRRSPHLPLTTSTSPSYERLNSGRDVRDGASSAHVLCL